MAVQSKKKLAIFSLIGVFNTLFDLALYVIFKNITGSIIIANTISTSAGVIGSYLLNSKITFSKKKWTKLSFIQFIVVTLFGLWILQTFVIYLISPSLSHIPQSLWGLAGSFEKTLKTVTPKLIATVVTFVWNYVWYNKVIFKEFSKSEQAAIALEEA